MMGWAMEWNAASSLALAVSIAWRLISRHRSLNVAPIFSGPVVFEWMGSLAIGILVTPSYG
jgi:hypothetical protein